jgi:dolichol-phosphate mannosyltransferase
MLAKYTISLLVLSLLLFVFIVPSQRKWLAKPVVYFSACIAVLLFLPVIYWNYTNDWSSFSFQTTRRIERESMFSLHYLILHIFILLGPLGCYLYVNSITKLTNFQFKSLNKKPTTKIFRYYFYFFTLVPLSVFIYFSLSHYPRFHWTAPVWLAVIPFMAHSISPTFLNHTRRQLANFVIYFGTAIALIYLIIFNFASLGIPANKYTRFVDHYYWKEVAAEIHQLEKDIMLSHGKRPVIIGLSKWSIASALRFYDIDKDRDNILSRNALGRTASMFEEWTNPDTWAGHPAIFVAINPKDLNSDYLTLYSIGLNPSQKLDIYHSKNKLRELHLRIADEYSPPSPQ